MKLYLKKMISEMMGTKNMKMMRMPKMAMQMMPMLQNKNRMNQKLIFQKSLKF